MNKPLYALVEQYRELQALDPEEIDSQMLNDTLEALGGEIQEKAKNVACFARNIESFADQVDEAATQMKERAKRLRDKATGIRGYILNQMRGAGITKIQAPEFTVAICKNPPAVQIRSDAVIPSEYLVKPEPPAPYPDKQKIKDALKAGVVIDGVTLEQGERLSIK